MAVVRHLTPEEMLQEAMTLPPSSVVEGRRVPLLDVLGQVTNRAKRVEIAHAYWQLARKLGEYRFCWEESQRIQAIGLHRLDANLLTSAQQAADRELTAAELALLQAQYRLAEVADLDSSGKLPLPGDGFHLGTYNTHFEQIFVNRSSPGQTRLIHRTLPLQHRVIDVRTEAVHAVQDALAEVVRSYGVQQVDAADVLAALHEITVQRRAWISAVARYNHSIADYALAIAGPETTGRDLVSILIKLSEAEPRRVQDKSAGLSSEPSPTLTRDTRPELPKDPGSVADVAVRPGVPTLAPPRKEMAGDARPGLPTPAPVRKQVAADAAARPEVPTLAPAWKDVAAETESSADAPARPGVPTLAPPRKEVAGDARPGLPTPAPLRKELAADAAARPEVPTLAPAWKDVATEPESSADAPARPGLPTPAPAREEVAADAPSQGLPPVPIDPLKRADLSVAPATADVPVAEDGGVAADSSVKAAVADVSVPEPATQTMSESERQDQPESKNEEPAEPSVARAENGRGVSAEGQATGAETPTLRSRDFAIQTHPMVAVDESEAAPRERTVYRQPSGSAAEQLEWPQANLIGLSAGVQAKRLTAILHGDASAICPEAEAIDLEACLDRVEGRERRSVIEAYWEASLRVAEYQVHRGRVAFLAELGKAVTLGTAGTTDARARLKAAQLDAKASLLEAENRLLDAQYELTKRCGRSLEGPWLVPKTLPHAGDYRLHFESQPQQMAESWTLKRLAAIVPALNRSLKDRAAAAIKADALRTEAVRSYQGKTVPFDRVLSAVDQQAEECLEFLNVLATYNQSIADYVTVVVPETLPEEQLVATLVVR